MCGIVGFLDKRDRTDFPLGQTLLSMLRALSCRGPDSAGVALLGGLSAPRLRLRLPPNRDSSELRALLEKEELNWERSYPTGVVDLRFAEDADPGKIETRIRQLLPDSEILCMGSSLSLFKQVGSPDELDAVYSVRSLVGTHGIGHTRMSTESRVDLSHSQPFWAHGVPDLATVHNGHITNYHKLRRRFEQDGHRFFTENDSEVIGVYLRDRMAAGRSLEGAMRASLEEFDGSFCYLVASRDQLGFVKDAYGFKPLMLAETEDFVALATEEIALRRALGRDFTAHEPAAGSLGLWSINPDIASGVAE